MNESDDSHLALSHPINPLRLARFAAILAVLSGTVVLLGVSTNARMVNLAPLYLLTPAIATFIVAKWSTVPLRRIGWQRGHANIHIGAGLLAIGALIATFLVSIASPDVSWISRPDQYLDVPAVRGLPGVIIGFGLILLTGVTVQAVLAVGSELGWRGYVLWELSPLGFWRASVVIGIAWGVWLAPIVMDGYLYPHFPIFGALVIVAWCIAASPIYTYLAIRGKSVLSSALFHGIFVAGAGVIIAATRTEGRFSSELIANPFGVAGIVVFCLFIATLALRNPPMSSRG